MTGSLAAQRRAILGGLLAEVAGIFQAGREKGLVAHKFQLSLASQIQLLRMLHGSSSPSYQTGTP